MRKIICRTRRIAVLNQQKAVPKSGLTHFIVLLLSIEWTDWDLFTIGWASFDQAIPLLTLNESHEKMIMETNNNWTIAYFYFHKLMGYIFGGFLVAGLAGLTQKN